MPDISRPYRTSVLLGLHFIYYQSIVPLGLSRRDNRLVMNNIKNIKSPFRDERCFSPDNNVKE
jgi:hypothetical protein